MSHLILVTVLAATVAGEGSTPAHGSADEEPEVAGALVPPTSMTPFEVDLVTHGVVLGGMVAFMATYQTLVRPGMTGGLTCNPPAGEPRCDPEDINAFDRLVVGNKNNDMLLGTDILTGALILGALVGTAVDGWGSGSGTPGTDFLTDAIVITEAAVLATAFAHLLKYSIRRPRPTQYAEVGSVASLEHQLAFPSGHSTAAAALAAAYTTTFWLRHPESPWRWAVLAGTGSVAVATGVMRAGGGFHWPTDVIAGLALGSATGFLVPYLLRRTDTSVVAAPMVGAHGVRGLEVLWQF